MFIVLTNNAANIAASSGKAITCQNGREYPLRIAVSEVLLMILLSDLLSIPKRGLLLAI